MAEGMSTQNAGTMASLPTFLNFNYIVLKNGESEGEEWGQLSRYPE